MLEIGDVALQIGEILADALRQFQIPVDIKVCRLGPPLGEVDEGAVGGPLVGPITLAQGLYLVENEFYAVLGG